VKQNTAELLKIDIIATTFRISPQVPIFFAPSG